MTLTSGRHVSLVFTTAPRAWSLPLSRLLFAVARRVKAVTAPLGKLEVINVVRWTIVERWPGEPAGAPATASGPILVFEGDFDGDLQLYIDSFAEIPLLRFLMWAVWGSSYGFPHVAPTDGFHRWVTAHESTEGHFYTAQPAVPPSTVVAALALDEVLDDFAASSAPLDDEGFAAAWGPFLRRAQAWL
jgi:hypothetical protein